MKCNIGKLIEAIPLSAYAFSQKTGVPYQTLRKWIKGQTFPNAYNLDVLCALLKCGIGDLYEAEPVDIKYMPVLKHDYDRKEYIRQVTMDNLRLRTRLRHVNRKELTKLPKGDI